MTSCSPSGFQEDTPAWSGHKPHSLRDWHSEPIHIAVTGIAGSGKSTLINTLRGLGPGDQGAAPVGVTESTQQPKDYPHPWYPNLVFWDLPGIGTKLNPRHTYLRKISLEKYDFVLIVSATRFTEDDLWLAAKLQRLDKGFYFIRTRLDEDIANDRRDHPGSHNEENVIRKIRRDCLHKLNAGGIIARVLVISGRKEHREFWDLPELMESLGIPTPVSRGFLTMFISSFVVSFLLLFSCLNITTCLHNVLRCIKRKVFNHTAGTRHTICR